MINWVAGNSLSSSPVPRSGPPRGPAEAAKIVVGPIMAPVVKNFGDVVEFPRMKITAFHGVFVLMSLSSTILLPQLLAESGDKFW